MFAPSRLNRIAYEYLVVQEFLVPPTPMGNTERENANAW
jgi:hypothetical protein